MSIIHEVIGKEECILSIGGNIIIENIVKILISNWLDNNRVNKKTKCSFLNHAW